LREHPIAVLLFALATAGLVQGTRVRRARRALLGPHRDRLLDEARAKADEVLELASSAATGEATVATSGDAESVLETLRRESERSLLPSPGGSQPH